MNSQRLVYHALSRSILLPSRGALHRSARCFGALSCATPRGPQRVPPGTQIVFQEIGSLSARRFCTEPGNIDNAAIEYFEFVNDYLNRPYVVTIDVRDPEELKDEGKIPGTRNIPLGQLEAVLSEGPEKFSRKFHLSTYDQEEGMNVVFLCKAGVRAAKAAAIARKHGFIRARFYKGSFLEWKERGGAIVKGP